MWSALRCRLSPSSLQITFRSDRQVSVFICATHTDLSLISAFSLINLLQLNAVGISHFHWSCSVKAVLKSSLWKDVFGHLGSENGGLSTPKCWPGDLPQTTALFFFYDCNCLWLQLHPLLLQVDNSSSSSWVLMSSDVIRHIRNKIKEAVKHLTLLKPFACMMNYKMCIGIYI